MYKYLLPLISTSRITISIQTARVVRMQFWNPTKRRLFCSCTTEQLSTHHTCIHLLLLGLCWCLSYSIAARMQCWLVWQSDASLLFTFLRNAMPIMPVEISAPGVSWKQRSRRQGHFICCPNFSEILCVNVYLCFFLYLFWSVLQW